MHDQVVASGDRQDRVHVARQAVQMRRHDRARRRRDHPLERRRIELNVAGSTSAKTTFKPGDPRELRHDPERQRGNHDFGAGGRSSAFSM